MKEQTDNLEVRLAALRAELSRFEDRIAQVQQNVKVLCEGCECHVTDRIKHEVALNKWSGHLCRDCAWFMNALYDGTCRAFLPWGTVPKNACACPKFEPKSNFRVFHKEDEECNP